MTNIPAVARAPDCGRHTGNDQVFCHVLQETVTISEAHKRAHSFGGIFPPQLTSAIKSGPLEGTAIASPYPRSAYRYPENRFTCDSTCRHKCMNG